MTKEQRGRAPRPARHTAPAAPPPASLRRHAEAQLTARRPPAPPDTDVERLMHELQVHQIELELQNEELLRGQAELEKALQQYTHLYDFAPVGYLTLARDSEIQQVNLTGAQMLGMERSRLLRRRFSQFVAVQSRRGLEACLAQVCESEQPGVCEVALAGNQAEPVWVRVAIHWAAADPGQPAACRVMVMDISATRRAEAALRESEAQFRYLAQALPDAVYTVELPAQTVSYFNHDTFFGYTRAQLLADNALLSVAHPADAPALLADWEQITSGHPVAPREHRVRTAAGGWEWVECRMVIQARHVTGAPRQVLIILTTTTERRQAEDALRHLSVHDALTGLYNRSYFNASLARLERGRQFPTSIVMADVDGLKDVNDRQGHATGDALLQRAAQLLLAAFRAEDVVARLGGDEFAVLLPGSGAAAARAAVRRVEQGLERHNAANPDKPVRLSLGVSTAVNPAPLAGLLNKADANMYVVKRGRVVSKNNSGRSPGPTKAA